MIKFITNTLSIFALFLLSACTQIGIKLANAPIYFSSVNVEKNIFYGKESWQKLDLYIPPNIGNKKLPVIVFFYGGRWTEGSKDIYKFIGKAFAEKNYIVAIPDYSKYPNEKFPTFVVDSAAAIAWTHDNIDEYNGDNTEIYVAGHSSGAHIGALAIADERYLKKHDKKPSIVNAFVGLAGPYDFEPKAEDLKDMFGPPNQYPQMQVPTFIEGNEPPMLLLWGAKDTTVYKRNLDLLRDKIEDKSGIVETKIYPNMDHFQIISNFTWFLPSKDSVLDDSLKFFKKY